MAEDSEETTRDFVLKRLAQELKDHPFANFVAHLLNTMGYRTRVASQGPDGGIDIVAYKDELGFQHYNQFDLRYKGLLPLRRVYVPEAIESDED